MYIDCGGVGMCESTGGGGGGGAGCAYAGARVELVVFVL